MKKIHGLAIVVILAVGLSIPFLLPSTPSTKEEGMPGMKDGMKQEAMKGMKEEKPSTPMMGDELVFKTVEGKSLTMKELVADGKRLVIYFFVTTCPVCEADLRTLNQLYPRYKEKLNLLVVGFDPSESVDQIKDYKSKRNYVWPFAEYNKEAILKYKVVTMSTKIGITMDGGVAFSKGYPGLQQAEWESLLNKLTS